MAEASLDAATVVSDTLKKMGVTHRLESGGRHMMAVYHVNGREHRFPFSHGKRWDGPIRHQIARDVRHHVWRAQQQK